MINVLSIRDTVRTARRQLQRNPKKSLVVLLILAFGLGLNSAVFTVVDLAIIRPYPFKDPKHVVLLLINSSKAHGPAVSYPAYLDIRSQAQSFSNMAIYHRLNVNWRAKDQPLLLAGMLVSSPYFKVLGVAPIIGRDFSEADDQPGSLPVVIISYGLWEAQFGKDPGAVGKTMVIDGEPRTIIGVAPRSQSIHIVAAWLPFGQSIKPQYMDRNHRFHRIVARLRLHTSVGQAQAELNTIMQRLSSEYPTTDGGFGIRVIGMQDYDIERDGRRYLYVIAISAALLVFMVACVNLVGFLLADAESDSKALAIKLALGASRAQLLVPSFLQAAVVAVVSIGFAIAAGKYATYLTLNRYGFLIVSNAEEKIDFVTYAFIALLGVLSSVAVFVLPTYLAIRTNIVDSLKGTPGIFVNRGFRLLPRTSFIAFQIALTCVLCLTSGLLIKSFFKVKSIDIGFRTGHLLKGHVTPLRSHFQDQAAIDDYFVSLMESVRRLPGVRAASMISRLPLTGSFNAVPLEIEGQPRSFEGQPQKVVDVLEIYQGYFGIMGIQMLQGRDFTVADRIGKPMVAIVDDVLASHAWPGQDPIGKRIRLADPGDTTAPWLRVIGISRQVKQYGPEQDVPRMQVYIPVIQEKESAENMAILIDHDGDWPEMMKATFKTSYSLNQDVALCNFEPLDELYRFGALGSRQVSAEMFLAFTFICIGLSVLGIVATVSTHIHRRRQELAIRIALGSTIRKVLGLVTTNMIVSSTAGLIGGVICMVLLNRVIASLLFGVRPLDWGIYVLGSGLLLLTTLCSAMIPAMTVGRINPRELLRQ